MIPPALKSPAWTWDFLSNPAYNYALINKHVPATSLATFINQQIYPAFRNVPTVTSHSLSCCWDLF